jgi:hypothetical protein
MNNGRVTEPAMAPLTPEIRRRVECLTVVRALYPQVDARTDLDELLRLTDYLVTGAF